MQEKSTRIGGTIIISPINFRLLRCIKCPHPTLFQKAFHEFPYGLPRRTYVHLAVDAILSVSTPSPYLYPSQLTQYWAFLRQVLTFPPAINAILGVSTPSPYIYPSQLTQYWAFLRHVLTFTPAMMTKLSQTVMYFCNKKGTKVSPNSFTNGV